MTENKQVVSLQAYNQEIQPKIRNLLKKQEIIKEWANDDETIAEYKQQIKEMNECIKAHIEEVEAQLVEEINALQIDIKLAIKAAAKASGYKPAELKGYMMARAKDKVEDAFAKAELFTKLDSEIF